MHFRQGRGECGVAFIGHHHHRAGFGDEKIAAGDAHLRCQIVAAQDAARLETKLGDSGLARRPVHLGEQVGDFLLALVQCRADDVRRRLVVVDLEDVLSQVGLDHLPAGCFDRPVQRRLFADHRFRLDGLVHAVALRDVEHVLVDLVRRCRPEHSGAAHGGVFFENLQPYVETIQRPLEDGACRLARRFEIVELDQGLAALGDEFAFDLLQVALELRIAHIFMGALLEMHRCDLHCDPCQRALRGIAGQQFGDVHDPGRHVAAPPQPALDIEHAPEITERERIGLRLRHELALVVGKPR